VLIKIAEIARWICIMGIECQTTCIYQNQQGEGLVKLESDFISFRGPFRFDLPFKQIFYYQAQDGWLLLDTLQGQIQLSLGRATVEKWMDKIANPSSLSQKLGIDHFHKIALLGVLPAEIISAVEKNTQAFANFAENTPVAELAKMPGRFDLIFVHLRIEPLTAYFDRVRPLLDQRNALWAISPKEGEFNGTKVIDAARANGLVDSKVIKISEKFLAWQFALPRE